MVLKLQVAAKILFSKMACGLIERSSAQLNHKALLEINISVEILILTYLTLHLKTKGGFF